MEEIKYEGAINPKKKEAKFSEKIDKQGRIPVPRMARDKLGIHKKEARVSVWIRIEEVYDDDE